MTKTYKIFIYGSLLEGYHNHDVYLDKATKHDGMYYTEEARFNMYPLFSYPAVADGGDHRIQGEVYEIDEATLAKLDGLESNGRYYEREEVEIQDVGKCWMYIIMKDPATSPPLATSFTTTEGVKIHSWKVFFNPTTLAPRSRETLTTAPPKKESVPTMTDPNITTILGTVINTNSLLTQLLDAVDEVDSLALDDKQREEIEYLRGLITGSVREVLVTKVAA